MCECVCVLRVVCGVWCVLCVVCAVCVVCGVCVVWCVWCVVCAVCVVCGVCVVCVVCVACVAVSRVRSACVSDTLLLRTGSLLGHVCCGSRAALPCPKGRDHRRPLCTYCRLSWVPRLRVPSRRSHLRRLGSTGRTAQTCVRRPRGSRASRVLQGASSSAIGTSERAGTTSSLDPVTAPSRAVHNFPSQERSVGTNRILENSFSQELASPHQRVQ